MSFDLRNLKLLSEGEVQSMQYLNEEIKTWKNGDTAMLTSSSAPGFIKSIITHKKRPESSRHKSAWYFGEAYVANKLAATTKYGWFSSFKWLYNPNWIVGSAFNSGKDQKITELKKQFYEEAIKPNIDKIKKLHHILKNNKDRFPQKPKAPDLWLIDKDNKRHFIEIKRAEVRDKPSDEQLFGLALIEKYLESQVHLVCLYKEGKNGLVCEEFETQIKKFMKFKNII